MEELDELIGKTEEGELLVVCGDVYGHVKESEGFEEVHGGYRKKEEHLIIFSSGGKCSQIDYILVNKKERKNFKNCKVMPGSHVVNQHNLVVLGMWRGKVTKAKVTRKGRFRTWELKKTVKKEVFKTMMKDKF